MRPVEQTTFGHPDGDCFMACIASVLEVSLADLPDLVAMEKEDAALDWWKATQAGVEEHGWYITLIPSGWCDVTKLAPQGFAIAGGPSPRALSDEKHPGHCIVCENGVMVHDPHPDNSGLGGDVEEWYLLIAPQKGASVALPTPGDET